MITRSRLGLASAVTESKAALRPFRTLMPILPVLAALALLAPASAWAYVDPGSGLVLWQGLIALVGAVLIFIRQPRESMRRFVDYLARLKKKR